MNIKWKLYLGVFIVLLGLICTISFQAKYIKKQKANIERLSHNQEALTTEIVNFKTKDSLNAATIKSLIVTTNEYKNIKQLPKRIKISS